MRVSIFFLLILSATHCFADAINDTIYSLGVSKQDLKAIWHDGRCEPEWSVKVSSEILKDPDLLGYKGLASRFFARKDAGDMVILKAGMKCDALNKYYFQGGINKEISDFATQDKKFIEQYGYSVLDAIFIENTQFFSWNGDVGKFQLKYAKELANKGLFTLTQKASHFNGKPSVAFSGERTPAGTQFHDNVFK